MWLYKVVNTRILYHKGGFILWRKRVEEAKIIVDVKLIYLVAIGSNIISYDQYELSKEVTLKTLIEVYKDIIDDWNLIAKK